MAQAGDRGMSDLSWPDGVEPDDADADDIGTQESSRSGSSDEYRYDDKHGYESMRGFVVVPDAALQDAPSSPGLRQARDSPLDSPGLGKARDGHGETGPTVPPSKAEY